MNSEAVERYRAAIARMNAIRVDPNSLPANRACRLALKDALRALRDMIAEETNPEARALLQDLLRTLKRLHYNLCVMDWCSVGIAVQEN
jgi:hypothetical protein